MLIVYFLSALESMVLREWFLWPFEQSNVGI